MWLDRGNSRSSYDQEGDGLIITKFPSEPANPPYRGTMSTSIAVEDDPFIHSLRWAKPWPLRPGFAITAPPLNRELSARRL
jgi:hypothetical protein